MKECIAEVYGDCCSKVIISKYFDLIWKPSKLTNTCLKSTIKTLDLEPQLFPEVFTAWKVSNNGVFIAPYFPVLDAPYLSSKTGKYGPEKNWYRSFSTQWLLKCLYSFTNIICLHSVGLIYLHSVGLIIAIALLQTTEKFEKDRSKFNKQ